MKPGDRARCVELKKEQFCFTVTPFLFWFLLLGVSSQIVVAQTQTEVREAETTKAEEQASQTSAGPKASPSPSPKDAGTKPKKEKRGSLVIAPIPISSPAFGTGVVLVAGYVFKLNMDDKVSPPSTVGLVAAFTNNGTGALGIGGRLYLKENKYQTTLAVAKGRANLDFFGIGRIPGRESRSVPLSITVTGFFGELMRNVGRDIFVGPRFQRREISARIDRATFPGEFEVPEIDRRSTSAALGFHVQRDLRDSTFYPKQGSLFDFHG